MITMNLIALNARINWWAVQVSNLRPLQCECRGKSKTRGATEGEFLADRLWSRLNAWKLHQIYTHNSPAFMRGCLGMFQSFISSLVRNSRTTVNPSKLSYLNFSNSSI